MGFVKRPSGRASVGCGRRQARVAIAKGEISLVPVPVPVLGCYIMRYLTPLLTWPLAQCNAHTTSPPLQFRHSHTTQLRPLFKLTPTGSPGAVCMHVAMVIGRR